MEEYGCCTLLREKAPKRGVTYLRSAGLQQGQDFRQTPGLQLPMPQ